MRKLNVWFANQITPLAGFHGDKSIFYEMKVSEADVMKVAERFGFSYFSNDTHFTLARPRYCS